MTRQGTPAAHSLRVLVDAASARRGGGVTFASGLIPALQRSGLSLHVLASPELRSALGARCEGVNWVEPATLTVLRVVNSVLGYGRLARSLGVDVVLFLGNYGLSLGGPPAVVIAQLDPDAACWEPVFSRGQLYWRVVRALMRVSYRQARSVLAVSQSLADKLHRDFGVGLDRLRVTHEGISRPDRIFSGPRSGVLAVTGSQPYKGGSVLARALKLVEQELGVRPAVAGVSAAEAQQSGWEGIDRVDWLGYIPQQRLMELCARTRVFVYQSYVEAFGLPPLEAMSRGAAVVAADLPAIREVCGPAAVYYDPGDPRALADAVAALYQNSGDCARQTRIGLERSAAFSWTATAEQVVQALQAAALGRPYSPYAH